MEITPKDCASISQSVFRTSVSVSVDRQVVERHISGFILNLWEWNPGVVSLHEFCGWFISVPKAES